MLTSIKSFFGILSTLQISLFTALRGKKMGTDLYGNTYFTGKPRPNSTRERRWVVYKGTAEASKVPPEWHGWLHHQTDVFPDPDTKNPYRHKWQKPHMPNLTGTERAYVPDGHATKQSRRADATGDYQPWTPSE